ncbi:ABC transporter permease [Parapedobacter tibetensis]|uniref:ABC transporter permease n=1 Tax=Parapedobacter tibetensis TaxID=2972951 RepID=UPI00214D225E|nr:ABC transporter permease [Parapedobacter tibetensis]
MIKNYFKTAWRNLLKNKVFSLINILGLAVGMTAFLLILQYVSFERSYDNFHVNASNIYRISTDDQNGPPRKTTLTPPPIGHELQKNYPEVVHFTRLILPWSGQAATSTLGWQDLKGNTIRQNFHWGFYTDPGFLKMFSFPWIKGDKQNALDGTNKIVLTESTARKLFGNDWKENDRIIGQTLEYINEFDRFSLVITGIMADAPENSHFQYDFLASFATLSTGWAKDFMETWGGHRVYTYLQLTPGADANVFSQKINEYVAQQGPTALRENTVFSLQPLKGIYLHSHREEELKVNGNATYISFLSMIAILILLIALVNYINLTTAKAVARGNEVGVRKVLGALRPQLIKQFLFESLLLNGVALVLSVILLQLAIPFYTQITGKALNYDSGGFWWFILWVFPISTLLAGLYPAFVLSGYHPMQVLKGKLMYSRSGKQLRKGMVVFQFWVSMILIIFTFAVYNQLHYMRNHNPGFDQEGVVVVKGPGNRTETWIEHDQQRNKGEELDPFKEAAAQYTEVKAISLSWSIPGERSSIWPIELGEVYDNNKIDVLTADNDYAEVYGLELLAGRFDTDKGAVINERAAEILGFDDPAAAVGQVFRDNRNAERNIQGVVRDYHHHSLQHEILPLMFVRNDPTYKLDTYYSIKVAIDNLEATLSQIGATYEKVYPHEPFEHYFIDSYFEAQYQEDVRFGKLFAIFSGLTIFIACLGLFGLSIHTVIEKTKEIGIRKILGASVKNILALLAKNTLKLILVACILALPISYWSIQAWLSDYAFRIDLDWWLFAIPVSVVLLIILLTIGFQALRAAVANPVDSLRDE